MPLETIADVESRDAKSSSMKRLKDLESRCASHKAGLQTDLQTVGVAEEFRAALAGLTPEARVEFKERLNPILRDADLDPKTYWAKAEG